MEHVRALTPRGLDAPGFRGMQAGATVLPAPACASASRLARAGRGRQSEATAGSVPRVILAIDQGTTGTTCLVFDADAQLAGRAYREFEQHFPRPGWVEHDAGEIWETTRAVVREALDDAGTDDLEAIGITNQRETVCVWDPETGEPLHHALVWQDRRTAATLRRAARRRPRAARAHADRARARPLLQRDEDRMAARQRRGPAREGRQRPRGVRHDRRLARLQAHRRAPHRRDERVAHDALRHRARRLGRRAARAVRRHPARVAARGAAEHRRVRHGARRRARRGLRRRAGVRDRGRPAGRAVRPGLPRPRPRQEHLRHGLVRAAELRRGRPDRPARPARDDRVGHRRAHAVRARGGDLRHGRGRAVAARRPRDHRRRRRDRGARGLAGRQTTASTSSRR